MASFILNRVQKPLSPSRWNRLRLLARSGERTERRLLRQERKGLDLLVRRASDGALTAFVVEETNQGTR